MRRTRIIPAAGGGSTGSRFVAGLLRTHLLNPVEIRKEGCVASFGSPGPAAENIGLSEPNCLSVLTSEGTIFSPHGHTFNRVAAILPGVLIA